MCEKSKYSLWTEIKDNSIQIQKDVEKFLYNVRIPAQVKVVEMVSRRETFIKLLNAISVYASDIWFITLYIISHRVLSQRVFTSRIERLVSF